MIAQLLDFLIPFSEVFVPLFVAMSPLTVLPVFITLTDGIPPTAAREMARRAVLTGLTVALGIVFLGQGLFRFLGITIDDLRVGGGLILLIISIYDLIFSRERRKVTELSADAGIVPLGIPLIVGPATMTTCVVLADSHGRGLVSLVLMFNLSLVWAVLHYFDRLQAFIRPAISRAFGKVMSLLLAAIAVSMLRSGIAAFVRSFAGCP
jgi:multiple antibiotic resistance protein